MKKNLYYRTMYKRRNMMKEFILNLFMAVSSYPKMFLEVFLRRNFGERYFSFATVITLTVVLEVLPWLQALMIFFSGQEVYWSVGSRVTWIIFELAFLFFGIMRWREVKRNPSVFDFEKFSLYSGDIHPMFFKFTLFGTPSVRRIETLYEPGLCLLIGLALTFFGLVIGYLITACAIIYALSYAGSYHQGDQFVMDKIDEMICNDEMFASFVEDKEAEQARGFRFYGRRPANDEIRRKVVDSFTEDSEPVYEAL